MTEKLKTQCMNPNFYSAYRRISVYVYMPMYKQVYWS